MEEKSQEQIIFENLHSSHLGGWWRSYPPKSLGNVIHWIYVYGKLDIAERVTVGDGEVHDQGYLFMRFKFTEENPDIPYFYDLQSDKYDYIIDNQEYYLSGLKKFPEYVKMMDERYGEIRKMLNGNG